MFLNLKTNLIWVQGRLWLSVLLVLAIFSWFGMKLFLPFFLLFFIFLFYFFRNPIRNCVPALTDDSVIIAPADGKVVEIGTKEEIKSSKNEIIRQFISGNPDGPIKFFQQKSDYLEQLTK